jgi:hypothetical protein
MVNDVNLTNTMRNAPGLNAENVCDRFNKGHYGRFETNQNCASLCNWFFAPSTSIDSQKMCLIVRSE